MGYRRLGKQLRREGIRVNDKRIRRVQRKYEAVSDTLAEL